MKVIAIILFIFCSAYNVYAQQVHTAKGSISYVIPKNMTLEQAEIFAVQEAKAKIIAENFGTLVGSTTSMAISDSESSITSFIFADLDEKGEWLETIDGPYITRRVHNNEFILDVTISGKIREIVSAPIQFQAKVLRNGVTDNCESSEFKNRDYMYMSFMSPTDGYVAVYITDGKDVQCLFPYNGLPAEYMKVVADKRYVFFSKENSGEIDPARVSRCQMGCQQDNEPNRIYLIFSPQKYTKAVDYSAPERNMPRTLSYKDFHSWLSKNKRLDKEFTCKHFDINIRK